MLLGFVCADGFFFVLFQWAPTLGGECYMNLILLHLVAMIASFNGHPPLGVNATQKQERAPKTQQKQFQWAPTLGGECYLSLQASVAVIPETRFNGHPPLGVNATLILG